jgi:hypothetical protein
MGTGIGRVAARLSAPVVLVLALAAPASRAASDVPCRDSTVTAIAWGREDAEHVCSAVHDALTLLHAMDLKLSAALTVHPLDGTVAASDAHPLGRYDSRISDVQILPFSAALAASAERPPAFGAPMTRDLWRSYIAHETAHAVADRYFASEVPHLAAGEYIAGVVQLLVLADATRGAILENYRHIRGWSSASEITSVFYFLAPDAFAIKSYRHFAALPPDEQRRFIARLVREGLRD